MSESSVLLRRLVAPAFLLASLAGVPAIAQENAGGGDNMDPFPARMEPLAAETLINAVTMVGDRLVAVGAWGHVLISEDQGKTWNQMPTPVNVTLTAVRFVDDKLGFASGHDAVILRTEDGGKTWAIVQYDPAGETPLFDIHMNDAQNGFAVGAYALMMTTSDGGKTWVRKPLGDLDLHLNAIATAKDGKIWIAGEAGHVFVTDGGLSQVQDIETPYSGSFWNVLPLSDGSVLAMGLRGNVWRTADQGATWTQATTDTIASVQSGIELKDGRVILVGLEGTVLVSADKGASFKPLKRSERTGVTAALQLADGQVLLFGEAGVDGSLSVETLTN
ncbi:WD40/YVTN/BNR-like repeat-containing protein [Zavarzinia sp.]|uniref:WD40/YVTN/BNR-like repeat-containing protein n=1 Tax=Zavarzinia sp. TaxID=2027920 RepID=UPI003BB5C3B6|nr:YCF48-related protein [Zavarzinia sp.]